MSPPGVRTNSKLGLRHDPWLNLIESECKAICIPGTVKNNRIGAFLVVQWLRIHLPMQRTWVPSLVRKDFMCCGVTKLMGHNYGALESVPCSREATAMRSLCMATREQPLLTVTSQEPVQGHKGSLQPKINLNFVLKKTVEHNGPARPYWHL